MKRKILACVLACATLFLGMGYAYWTQGLQINTTAKTGELNVKFVDLAVYGQYADEKGWAIYDGITPTGAPGQPANFTKDFFFDRDDAFWAPNDVNIIATTADLNKYKARIEGYTKTSFTAGLASPVVAVPAGSDDAYGTGTNASDGIDVTLDNMYPGYAQFFRTDILNIGTLAAKLTDVKATFSNSSNAKLDDMIGVSLKVLKEDGKSVKVLDVKDSDVSRYIFTIGNVDFVRLSALKEGKVVINSGTGSNMLYIYPGDNTMDAIFGVAMDPDYAGAYTTGHVGITTPNADADTEIENAQFTMQFLWDQFNTPNPAPAH